MGLTLPYQVRSEAVTSGTGVKYNGYAHSFGGMGIQFILFLGIDIGIGLLMQRQTGVWKRLRAAPLSRGVLLGSRATSAAITSMFVLMVLFAFARVVFGVRIQGSVAGFLGVCAAFHHPAFIQDHDFVAIADGRQPVGNHNAGCAVGADIPHHRLFSLGVQG